MVQSSSRGIGDIRTTRRRVLATTATLAVVGLAGCADEPNSDGSLRVTVNNQRGTAQRITVTVTDSDGEQHVKTTDTVPANVSQPFESSGYEDGQYTIQVQGEDWATSSVWRPSVCRNFQFLTRLNSPDQTPMVTAESSCLDDQE